MIAKRGYKLSFQRAVKSPLTSLTAFFVNLSKLGIAAINLLSGQEDGGEGEGKGKKRQPLNLVPFISKAVAFQNPTDPHFSTLTRIH